MNQEALDKLIDAAQAGRNSCWEKLRIFLRCSPQELDNAGHRDVGSAVVWTMEQSVKRIEKLTREYERANPDRK